MRRAGGSGHRVLRDDAAEVAHRIVAAGEPILEYGGSTVCTAILTVLPPLEAAVAKDVRVSPVHRGPSAWSTAAEA